MRILLDESLPRKLTLELPGHDARTVQKRGWSGLKNGALLREESQAFQVLASFFESVPNPRINTDPSPAGFPRSLRAGFAHR